MAKILGQNIRRRRRACSCSQEELSARIGIHYTFLGHIERGTRMPRLSTLRLIAKALDVSLASLLKGAD
jgi:transcriptional regulator with XRE-family HTH domain